MKRRRLNVQPSIITSIIVSPIHSPYTPSTHYIITHQCDSVYIAEGNHLCFVSTVCSIRKSIMMLMLSLFIFHDWIVISKKRFSKHFGDVWNSKANVNPSNRWFSEWFPKPNHFHSGPTLPKITCYFSGLFTFIKRIYVYILIQSVGKCADVKQSITESIEMIQMDSALFYFHVWMQAKERKKISKKCWLYYYDIRMGF